MTLKPLDPNEVKNYKIGGKQDADAPPPLAKSTIELEKGIAISTARVASYFHMLMVVATEGGNPDVINFMRAAQWVAMQSLEGNTLAKTLYEKSLKFTDNDPSLKLLRIAMAHACKQLGIDDVNLPNSSYNRETLIENPSYFPIKVYSENEGRVVICLTPEEIPSGVITIIQTNCEPDDELLEKGM